METMKGKTMNSGIPGQSEKLKKDRDPFFYYIPETVLRSLKQRSPGNCQGPALHSPSVLDQLSSILSSLLTASVSATNPAPRKHANRSARAVRCGATRTTLSRGFASRTFAAMR